MRAIVAGVRSLRSAYRMNRSRDRSKTMRHRGAGRDPLSCRVPTAPKFRNDPGRRLDNRRTARPGPADSLRRVASLHLLPFAPTRKFRRAASRAELFVHAVTRPSARARYVVGLPSCASAFSNSCLTPRASAGARAQNSRREYRLRSRQAIRA
jgi:hypothetical protein